jgi:CRP-like cAMP-binding protein
MTSRQRLQQADVGRLRDFGVRALSHGHALSEEEQQQLRVALSDLQTQPAGSELFTEGERLNRPCLLLEGWAARQRVLSDGRRQIFSFVLPGDGFGFSGRPAGMSPGNVVALTAVTVVPLPLLEEALYRDAADPIRQSVWEMLALRESLLANQVMRLGRQSAYERLVHLLLEFHERLAAVGLVQDGSFEMPFTQEVLSDALGLSTVHTNRTLQQLRREHLIETHGTAVRLLDLKLLAEIADYRRAPGL